MYLQIIEQVSQRIASGYWPPGHKMPSIREMALALNVSVITVKRAYLELEREGLIVTRQGQGSWVSETLDQAAIQFQELEQTLERAATLAGALALSEEELVALLKDYLFNRRSTNGPGN
ncbi:MAG: GntR family transcriptional regulator [Pseudomonadota bacterium]